MIKRSEGGGPALAKVMQAEAQAGRPDPWLEAFGFTALWRSSTPGQDDMAASIQVAGTAGLADPAGIAGTGSIAAAAGLADAPGAMAAGALASSMPGARAMPVMASNAATSGASATSAARSARSPEGAERSSEMVRAPVSGLDDLSFDALRARVTDCRACRLCETRTNAVFGVGDPQADWLFVGEGPGATEDAQGEPFVGQAGKLLDNMLRALGLQRESNVFIANVVKCRPPNNRDPEPDEIAACDGYLRRQIALIQPKIIVALGRFAAQTLLRSDATIGALRRANAASPDAHRFEGVPVVTTYHPAYLLRTPSDKAKVWDDLCRARGLFGDA